jgi:hypothetical protein
MYRQYTYKIMGSCFSTQPENLPDLKVTIKSELKGNKCASTCCSRLICCLVVHHDETIQQNP